MKPLNQISKKIIVSVLSVGSLLALSACSDPAGTDLSQDGTATDQTAPGATTAEQPTAEPGITTETPATVAPGETTATTEQNIVEVAATSPTFSTFTKAVDAAGLGNQFSQEGPYTVFAPTDEAFAALPAGTLDNLLLPENKDQLVKVLSYHVVPGEVTAAQITPGAVDTAEGEQLNVQIEPTTKAVMVNDAKVVQPDIQASNGVIHGVDKVILPPDVQLTTEPTTPTN